MKSVQCFKNFFIKKQLVNTQLYNILPVHSMVQRVVSEPNLFVAMHTYSPESST